MRAVWSLWSKPLHVSSGWGWSSVRHHLLSWVLSFETARRHYPRTALVTDDDGAALLCDGLGLPFDDVSTALNVLDHRDPALWCLGKLHAYARQSEPFVHLDCDVYLWRRLPEWVESAPVFAQNPEPFRLGYSDYRPEMLEATVRRTGGWLPPEFDLPLPIGSELRGACCGILGGQDTGFLRYYARLAGELVEHPHNTSAWQELGNASAYTTTVEQFFLEACIAYHRDRTGSPHRGIRIAYLFDSPADAYARADDVGYTHLISNAKRNPTLLEGLERRVSRDYPAYYERCIRVANWTGPDPAVSSGLQCL